MSGPLVTGVSPSFGPPGTKITIRGEHLGTSQYDIVSLTICGLNCLHWAEWHKPSMIVCRTGAADGPGEIIVTTRSGGQGDCNVVFTSQVAHVGPMVESAIWVDETEFLDNHLDRGKREERRLSVRGGNFDPLGLGDKIGRGQKVTSEFLEGLYPGGNGDLHSEKFVAAWYLLEQHRNTSFSDLQRGLHTLRMEVDKKSVAPSNYAKENLTAYLLGEQSLQDFRKMIVAMESKSEGGSITDKLDGLLSKSDTIASTLFKEVLERKEKADATRNALNVLQRFKFLFSLPKSIAHNIESGDIDMVVSDYERTKSLFTGGEVQVFQKVLLEVTRLVADFRRELRGRLNELPSSLEEQKRMVKFLIQLDYSGDPGWEALEHMFRWIINLVEVIRDRYQTIGSEPIPLSDLHSAGLQPQAYTQGLWKREPETRPPKRVGMTEELCELHLEVIPDFWALARAYLSGDLLHGITDTEAREAFSSGRREADANEMLQFLLQLFCDMISCAFFEEAGDWEEERRARVGEWKETKEPLEEWLPFCVRQVRHCTAVLLQQLPIEDIQCCVKLSSDLRALTVQKLFVRAETDTGLLHERENWVLEAEEHGSISSLPVLFESVVVETLLTLKDIVQDTATDQPTRLLHTGSKYVVSILQKLIECFRYLAFEKQTDGYQADSGAHNEPSSSSEDSDNETGTHDSSHSDLETGEDTKSEILTNKRLLIIQSNIQFIKSQVLPRIMDCYKLHGYPDSRNVENGASRDLKGLDTVVFNEYVKCKSVLVSEVLEAGMGCEHFDWEECSYPQTVRGYIKELIMLFIEVHSECYSVSALLIIPVLESLLQSTSESMLASLRKIETFCHEGAMHAQIELTVVEKTLSRFLTPASVGSFDRAYKYLSLDGTPEDSIAIRKIIAEFQQSNRLQLLCFRADI